jgi:hypothetical protein
MYIHQMPLFPRLFRIILDVRMLTMYIHQMPLFPRLFRIILDVRMLKMYIHQMPLFPRLFRIILDVRTLVCFFHFIDTMFIIVQYIVVFQRIRKDPCMIYSISEIKKTNIKWKYNSTNSNYIFQIRERFNFFSK